MTADNYEPVRDQFIDGLANSIVQEKVRDQRPATLAQALIQAQDFEAAQAAQRAAQNGNGGRRRALNQIDNRPQRTCWECQSPHHLARDCPLRNNSGMAPGRVPGGRGRRGRGGRGGGSSRGGRGRGRGGSGGWKPRPGANDRSRSSSNTRQVGWTKKKKAAKPKVRLSSLQVGEMKQGEKNDSAGSNEWAPAQTEEEEGAATEVSEN